MNTKTTHALLSDVTQNRSTVELVGTEDECREACTDDRWAIMAIFGESETPVVGQRVHHWHDGTREVCG